MSLLEISDLHAEFRLGTGVVHAVNGMELSISEGETLALVGESGSGKSATALSVLRLNPSPPCVYTSGEIRFAGRDLLHSPERELRRVRGSEIAMIFQDPMTSLDPVQRIGAQITETVRRREGLSRYDARRRAVSALREVGIPEPERRIGQYPHEFSGGMRQRVMIAMALASRPRLLIADEPTTALDVTVQAQILDLLAQLRERHGTAVILITHDLGVVARAADRVLVMYAGRPVETGAVDDVFARPTMPYSEALLAATPRPDTPRTAELPAIPGLPPRLDQIPAGCAFRPRCSYAFADCAERTPALTDRGSGHRAACLLPELGPRHAGGAA